MNEEKPCCEKHNSYRFKLWCSNIRKNWGSYIFNLLLYIIPFIVIEPRISEYIVGKFKYVVLLLVIIFLINEFMKTNELIKHDLEVNKIKEKRIRKKPF